MDFDHWWYQVHWEGKPTLENMSTERSKNFAKLGWDAALQSARAEVATQQVPAELLKEACIIGLAVAGGLAPDGDGAWLQGHEKRLRELERLSMNSPRSQEE